MLSGLKSLVSNLSVLILAYIFISFIFRKDIFILAFKNLLKNSRRTLILFCVIVSGLAGLMLFFGYAEHAIYGLRETSINSGMGHVQLYKKGYNAPENVDKLKYSIPNYREIVAIIHSDPFLKDKIKDIAAELYFSGMIASESESSIFSGVGVEVDKYVHMNASEKLVEGNALKIDGGHQSLIGTGLESALKTKVGNILTLMVSGRRGNLNALDTKIEGIIRGYAKEYNDIIVKIPIQSAWVLMNNEVVSRIAILLKDTAMTNEVSQRIQKIIAEKNLDLELTVWEDIAVVYKNISSFMTSIFITIGIVITMVVYFSISNVTTMSVMERTRQIGTLRAIGETKSGIKRLFRTEGLLIGTFGAGLSILVGIGIAEFINNVIGGIPHPPPPGSTQGYTVFFYVANRPIIWGISFLLAFFSAFFSSIRPARKAAAMDIVESLRYT